jgi:hypothetical protein
MAASDYAGLRTIVNEFCGVARDLRELRYGDPREAWSNV